MSYLARLFPRAAAVKSATWLAKCACGTLAFLLFSTLSASAQTTVSFQTGINGYNGTVDSDLRQASPNTPQTFNDVIFVDAPAPSDEVHAFIRFDSIIGNSVGQIPLGASITSASIRFTVPTGRSADGQGGNLHRLLTSLPETATWNSTGGGIQANGVEAISGVTASIGDGTTIVQPGTVTVDVRTDVQLYSNGTANNGWAIIPWTGGTNGWGFLSRDQAVVASRPLLSVTYSVVPEAGTLALLGFALVPVGVGLARRRSMGNKRVLNAVKACAAICLSGKGSAFVAVVAFTTLSLPFLALPSASAQTTAKKLDLVTLLNADIAEYNKALGKPGFVEKNFSGTGWTRYFYKHPSCLRIVVYENLRPSSDIHIPPPPGLHVFRVQIEFKPGIDFDSACEKVGLDANQRKQKSASTRSITTDFFKEVGVWKEKTGIEVSYKWYAGLIRNDDEHSGNDVLTLGIVEQ